MDTELELAKVRYAELLDFVPVGLLLTDARGVVKEMNRAGADIVGINPSSLVGKPLATLVPEEQRSDFEASLADIAETKTRHLELIRQDGSALVVEATVQHVGVGDEGPDLRWALHDVTAREQSERVEREFVTNAAHELQSPLAAIVSTIEVLQAGAKDGPQRDVFLGHIEREADRLARLVRALLILARTQMGLEAPRDELVALCPLLEEVGSTLRVDPGVEVVVDCARELGVLTNRELVEQAVVNLAENAAKNTSTGRIILGAQQLDRGAVEISVTDTGPGIPAAERSRVFERFYRARDVGATGFGLGLAIVRAVADALEGELELDSTIGVGTVFRLRLPHVAAIVTA